MLPLVVACLLSVVGVTMLCVEHLRLADVARLCARTASTADDPVGTARSVALAHRAVATAVVDPPSSMLTVTVRSESSVPGLGFVAARAGLSASVVIALEQSPLLR